MERVCIILSILFFQLLNLNGQEDNSFPYVIPGDLNENDFTEISETDMPEVLLCDDQETASYKMKFSTLRPLSNEIDTILTFKTEKDEWKEEDEKLKADKLTSNRTEYLQNLFQDNQNILNEMKEELWVSVSQYLDEWQNKMCDMNCQKRGDECKSVARLKYIDAENKRCQYDTRFSYLTKESESNKVQQVVVPAIKMEGYFYFNHTCSCDIAEDAIAMEDPVWNNIKLTGKHMKPGITQPATQSQNSFPSWIPITGGIVTVGVVTYFILEDDEGEENDNEIEAIDDSFTFSCGESSFNLDVTSNDRGSGIFISFIENTSGAVLSIVGNSISVESYSDDTFSFTYTIENSAGKTSTAAVNVIVEESSITAIDDNYESDTPIIEGNLLNNDQGNGLKVIFNELVSDGELNVQADGNFRFEANDGFSGTAHFAYLIEDNCNKKDTAICSLTIIGNNCDLTTEVETMTSECGQNNGEAILTVSPDGDYNYEWNDGGTGNSRKDLEPGRYSVIVISQDQCRDTIEFDIEEENFNVEINSEITDADCGKENGEAEISVTPSGSYEFHWSDGGTGNSRNDLSTGNYQLIITASENCSDTFSIEIGAKEPVLNLQTEAIAGDCETGGDIKLNYDNTQAGELIINIEGPSGNFMFSTDNETMVSLSEFITVLPGNYNITIWNENAGNSCSENDLVKVENDGVSIMLVDDSYTTNVNSGIQFNVLDNDSGNNLMLTSIANVINGVLDYTASGDISFIPDMDFVGVATFNYFATDACGEEQLANVTIRVVKPDCDFTVSFNVEKADCGLDNGLVDLEISPNSNYSYEWSNGSTEKDLKDVPTGFYAVSVTDIEQNCTLEFEVNVPEKEAKYIENLTAENISCGSPGEVEFDLISPGGGDMLVQVFYGANDIEFSTGTGHIVLSDYIDIVEAQYIIIVNDLDIGLRCEDVASISVNDNRENLEIQLLEAVPPSSPSAMDGFAIFKISMETAPPYSIFLNGDLIGSSPGGEFVIEDLSAGKYTVQITDRNGCISNEVLFILETFTSFNYSVNITNKYISSVFESIEQPPIENPMRVISPEISFTRTGRKSRQNVRFTYLQSISPQFGSFQFLETTVNHGKNFNINKSKIHFSYGFTIQNIIHKDQGKKNSLRKGLNLEVGLEKLFEKQAFPPIRFTSNIFSKDAIEFSMKIQVPID